MTNWHVTAHRMGRWTAVPGPELFWMSHWEDPWVPVSVIALFARSDDGRTVVVNTGADADYLPFMNAHWAKVVREDCQFVVEEDDGPLAMLQREGVKPEEVDHVICTPFQAYTTGNLPLFTNAEICLSRRGWESMFLNPLKNHPHDGPKMLFPPASLQYVMHEAIDRVKLLEDEDTIAEGLSTFFTGGHHRASIGVSFDTEKGKVIASDTAFLYENVEQNHPLGISENIYETLEAYQRFRAEGDLFVPLYEQRIFDRHPGGVIA